MRGLTLAGTSLAIGVAWASPSSAIDCGTLLKSFFEGDDPHYSRLYVTMVTLNVEDVASFSETRLFYIPARKQPGGGVRPGSYRTLPPNSEGIDSPKFDFGQGVQVFSDRVTGPRIADIPHVGLPQHGLQKFDERRADDIGLELLDTTPVRVIVTLRSWDDAKVEFIPTCEEGGFMYGATPDVSYLLRLSRWPPPPRPQ